MLPMMIFGVTALGVVTIPMGFQFLAVLGGKALLLAKMALMLAMMNGLKRVWCSYIIMITFDNGMCKIFSTIN